MTADWEQVRAVADAVLYEGYLLYPYRADSQKNQSRWQFGVLGPPGAAQTGIGEDSVLSSQLLVRQHDRPKVSIVVRFLQLQRRTAERRRSGHRFEAVDELVTAHGSWLTWDEAIEHEIQFGPFDLAELGVARRCHVAVRPGTDIEYLESGRLVRSRRELRGQLSVACEPDDGLLRLSVSVVNTAAPASGKHEAVAVSLIGTHLVVSVADGEFVSLLDPPADASAAATRCRHHRCFPVLAGPPEENRLMLVSPIILYDHPEIAEQSGGALYDSTEIDEILTLRIMTMTDQEKVYARATDPRAADIIDRCESMSPEAMLNLHGVLRNPHAAGEPGLIPELPDGIQWWDPLADGAVDPAVDAVLVNGVRVSRGSRVRLHPSRRADAQDLFFVDKIAHVTSVHEDVDGERHLGVVLDDDPAADLHEWYGRYLYFSPDEVEPLVQ
ncbi:hypothetical protein [Mycolicibacterium brisbanense]|uniref:Uncharacterized protein n=1 Tax=Mycolicibacterium brisbanense TaxID=146020 RepID=A0A100W3T6_9MYCO|nr:hypothetical protein [Mycolicibacterium brisbanense]MCV7158192.1 hypothetical protein [Mycolicibacterium brisbanense]GAS91124.1 uncharacterized protein RMCB_5220 [Mycolicibacterium brisbanense]